MLFIKLNYTIKQKHKTCIKMDICQQTKPSGKFTNHL